ncbi:hypothetical protein BDR26DRAFT_858995 [Obelidium mucronatum]|nr:hypothetical protein BDR26DRAFT_858995 [Obelidium mucronatum]
MDYIATPYSLDASKQQCWKCKGSGFKKARKPVTQSKSPALSQAKKRLVDIPCPLCTSGALEAAPLNNMTRSLPDRVSKRGFIRPFRPHEGWICPGPNAVTDIHDAAKLLQYGEMITSLCGSWSIHQLVQGHRYTTDDLSTAAIAIQEYTMKKVPLPKRHVDIGCGLGSVLLFVRWKFHESLETSLGIEAQQKHVELARRSVSVNMGSGKSNTSSVRHGDLRSLAEGNLELLPLDEENSFDLVTGTPPYFPVPNGVVPTVEGRGMCSFELRGGIETYCLAAKRCLKKSESARFVFVQTAIEIVRSEIAIWDLGKMKILERVDFYGSEIKKNPLFVVFVCCWGEARVGYSVRKIAVRKQDGSYSKEYHDMLVLVGKPPIQ